MTHRRNYSFQSTDSDFKIADSIMAIFRLLPWLSLIQKPSVPFFFFFNVYLLLRDRERQSMSRGGAERGGDTESKTGTRLRAVSTELDAEIGRAHV